MTGAGARSNAFQRVVADLSGRAVSVPRVPDAVCLGAAIQAAAVLHQRTTDDVADAWGVGAAREVEPAHARRRRGDQGRLRVGALRFLGELRLPLAVERQAAGDRVEERVVVA